MTGARQRRAWLGVPLLGLAAAAAWLTIQAGREARARSSERLPARQVSGLVALSVLTLASLAVGLRGVMTVLIPLFG